MMKKVTLTKLESIMQRMRKALRTIEKVSLELGLPGVQVRLDPLLQAGVDAELISLDLRSLLEEYHSENADTGFGDIAHLHEFSMEERNGVFWIRMPMIPLNDSFQRDGSYVAIPLLCSLKQYGLTHEIPIFDDAVITVCHHYPANFPVRYLRDHNHLAMKKVLDVIGLYFFTDDRMEHCDLYYTSKLSDSYFTEIFIAAKPENQGIIGSFAVGESDEKSGKIGMV